MRPLRAAVRECQAMIASEFEESLTDWEVKLAKDEWYFTRLRAALTLDLNQEDSFKEIEGVLALLLKQHDEYLALECLELVFALARHSQTTEMPARLDEQWSNLKNHMACFGDYHLRRFKELATWYRRSDL
jgi:hypothetical protein